MYEIYVEDEFAGAHRLRNYRGKCENLHGHNWKVSVSVRAEKPGADGLVVDFQCLRRELETVLEKLDHGYLNEVAYFRRANPSSENIAFYVHREMKKALKNLPVRMGRVTVWENLRQSASYFEESET